MKVLVIGKPTYNFVFNLENFPKEGSNITVPSVLKEAGSCGIYVSQILSKWGMETYYTGVVGSDEYGTDIKRQLEEFKVNTKFLEVNYQDVTSLNYVIVNKENSSSTEIKFDKEELYLTKYKYDINPDVIIFDGTDYHGAIAAINNYPNTIKILYAPYPNEKLYDISKRCNYVVASLSYAQALTKMTLDLRKTKSILEFMQRIKDLNKASYIVNTDEGALYISDNQAKLMPPLKENISIDKTHEDYMFYAGFIYGILNKYSMDDSVKIASSLKLLSKEKLGSKESMIDINDVFSKAGVSPTLPKMNQEMEVL